MNIYFSLSARRSISAKHNSSDSKSFSKSFSNTKKEELMKVINEAKQKLENVSIQFRRMFGIQFVRFLFYNSFALIIFKILSFRHHVSSYV